MGVADLSAFACLSPLLLDSNIFDMSYKGPVRQEAYIVPFIHILMIFNHVMAPTWV